MSGSVFLSNLDDFIAPSQACVNPLVSGKLDSSVDVGTTEKSAKVTISNDYSRTEFERAEVKPNLINTKVSSAKKVASISLNDCLACSGCVTSAETVLIQEQSYEKLLDQLSLPSASRPIIIIAISPNSIASISTFLNMDPIECFLRIASVLKQLGVSYVIDASSGGDVALVEAREEFLQRYKEGQRKTWTKPPTTTAFSSTAINVFSHTSHDSTMNTIMGTASLQPEVTHQELPDLHTQLPVLSSHCPGWVCYAEKSQPQAIPFVSTVKSAQQILGSILKSALLPVGDGSKSVYFVSIQPCFDKKLEASRLDFYHTEESCAEVDLVISTTELWRLLEAQITTTSSATSGSMEEQDMAASQEYQQGNVTMKSTEEIGTAMLDDGTDDDDGLIRAVVKKAKLCDDDGTSVDAGTGGSTTATSSILQQESKLNNSVVLEEGGESITPAGGNKSVLELLLSVLPDNPGGCDLVEQLCRSCSADGRAFLVASDRNAGSGGYTEYIFKYAAQQLYNIDLWSTILPYKEGRNPDIAEIDINTVLLNNPQCNNSDSSSSSDSSDGLKKLKFARAYGFRNIQSVMLKVRRGQCEYDFIEIMACPSGCNNGGGQIRQAGTAGNGGGIGEEGGLRETPTQSRERVAHVEGTFHRAMQVRRPEDNPLVQFLYASTSATGTTSSSASTSEGGQRGLTGSGSLSAPLSESARRLLHTRYHAVPKLEAIAPLAAKW